VALEDVEAASTVGVDAAAAVTQRSRQQKLATKRCGGSPRGRRRAAGEDKVIGASEGEELPGELQPQKTKS
jgi:hypothetical protein